MTPKTLLTTLILLAGLSAHAQVQATTGKLFIINKASESAIVDSANPLQALIQTDRVELTKEAVSESNVSVKRCGLAGCTDPVGRPVDLRVIHRVNSAVSATALADDGKGDGGCRVCRNTKTIPTNLDSYVNQIKATEP